MSKALLVVHGIGEQQRGQTTEKLVSEPERGSAEDASR